MLQFILIFTTVLVFLRLTFLIESAFQFYHIRLGLRLKGIPNSKIAFLVERVCIYENIRPVETFCIYFGYEPELTFNSEPNAFICFHPLLIDGVFLVVSAELLSTMSNPTKHFMVLHELAHAEEHRHIIKRLKTLFMTHVDIKEEIGADSFAMSRLGRHKIVAALNEILNSSFLISNELAKYKLNHRIMAIHMPTLFRQYA